MGRLVQMTVFTAVVDAGGFSAAARALGLAKSTVSRHVAELEERLGVRLLQRTTRAVRPTELGLAYYERCVQVVADADEADRVLTSRLPMPSGRLTIAAPPQFAARYLMAPIHEFLNAYPDVEVNLVLDDRFVDVVDDGIDVAIRVSRLEDSSLVARRLGVCRSGFVGAPSLIERFGLPKTLDDVLAMPGVGHALFLKRPLIVQGPDGQEVHAQPVSRFQANDGDALIASAVAGIGVAWAPDFLVQEHLQAGRLIHLLPDWTEPKRVVHALYPHRRHLSAKVRAFIDSLVDRFADDPPWRAFDVPVS